MNLKIMTAFLASGLCLSAVAASITTAINDQPQSMIIVNHYELTEEEALGFTSGEKPNLVLKIEQGSVLDLNLFLSGNIVEFTEYPEINVIAKQNIFIRHLGDGNFVFSSNLIDWKSLLEFTTGTFNAGLNFKDGATAVSVSVEADLRE